jgi:hypothetical protein
MLPEAARRLRALARLPPVQDPPHARGPAGGGRMGCGNTLRVPGTQRDTAQVQHRDPFLPHVSTSRQIPPRPSPHGNPRMTAEIAFTRKLIEIGKQARDLQDEVTRLRAFMPADVLREYDRRKNLERQSAFDAGIPVSPRSGTTPAAAQEALERIVALDQAHEPTRVDRRPPRPMGGCRQAGREDRPRGAGG